MSRMLWLWFWSWAPEEVEATEEPSPLITVQWAFQLVWEENQPPPPATLVYALHIPYTSLVSLKTVFGTLKHGSISKAKAMVVFILQMEARAKILHVPASPWGALIAGRTSPRENPVTGRLWQRRDRQLRAWTAVASWIQILYSVISALDSLSVRHTVFICEMGTRTGQLGHSILCWPCTAHTQRGSS